MPKDNFYGQFSGGFDLEEIEAENEDDAYIRAPEIWDEDSVLAILKDTNNEEEDATLLALEELWIGDED